MEVEHHAPATFRTVHALVPLFPAFLRRRRRGFPGLATQIAETGLSRPAFFLLHQVAQRGPDGATAAALRPGAPYSTRDPHLPWLDEALSLGYLTRDDEGRYRLSGRGLAHETLLEREVAQWFAVLRPLPAEGLIVLADRFAAIANRLDDRADDPAAHLHWSRRTAALAPEASRIPLVRLERAIFDLWMARDDAHIGAWSALRFYGPQVEVLTRLWRGEAETLAGLHVVLASGQEPDETTAIVNDLIEQGYVAERDGIIQPTRAGYHAREAIEADTDELYFQQWPPLTPYDTNWLGTTLTTLIDNLPGPAPS